MFASRIALMLAGGIGLFVSAPASAQFFLKPANLESGRVNGSEPGMTGPALPGATPVELQAALAWNLRAALNVAALQCQFEPTLLSVDNYNSLIKDHAIELRDSYATLEKYFARTYKNKKQGQLELDKYGTRIYSGFSTVQGQLSFCQTAAAIGHDAVFVKPGKFSELAQERIKELRASLGPWGEQYRPSGYVVTGMYGVKLPPFGNDKCWKKGQYQVKKCGPLLLN
ncbi:hypothetical protein HNP52_003650 [Sphingomonas kyeonggiensis]|uniref:Uncharacterized protein n=1 Tax=Sphingomonas kyeonggiensis TaxID=1268553 RepID=A0A7W7NT33_9SPHN|nr:hypothetical protein [Sphingomonas kyeonggiensis]MBB4840558.1 hypothetical protein [Sphingomonas kyeonggiensis]